MNYETMDFFQDMRKARHIPFIISTFESKHGHSLCDGHFGSGKSMVRRQIQEQSSSLCFTRSFVQEVFSKLKNTKVFEISLIESEKLTKKKEERDLKEIKKQRCFDFRQEKLVAHHYTEDLNLF